MAQRFTTHNVPLSAGQTFTGDPMLASSADRVTGTVFSDQAGTIYIEQSGDQGKNWDLSTSYAVAAAAGAGQGYGFSEEVLLPYVRIRFTNSSGSNQTVFRLYGRFQSSGARP